MKERIKKFEDISTVEFLLLRERLGINRYRKRVERDAEEKEILLHLGLKKIEEKERDDFTPVGHRRRRLKIL